MTVFNREKLVSHSASVLLGTWIAFTSFYTLLSFGYSFIQSTQLENARQTWYIQWSNDIAQRALQSFSGNVFQNWQMDGQQLVVGKLMQELSMQYEDGCTKAVPVTVGTGSIGILSTACLEMLAWSGSQQPVAPRQ